jgi:hypothetical protein
MRRYLVPLLAVLVFPGAPAQAAAAAAVSVVETEAGYIARCRMQTVSRTPALAAQADAICRANWQMVVAAAPIADALLAAAPRQGAAFDPAALRTVLPSVQWAARPEQGAVASGRVMEIYVAATRMPVLGLTLSWFKEGESIPFLLEDALRVRGATLLMIGCPSFGASESTRVYRVAAGGKPPFTLTIAREAAVASQSSDFNASTDFSGRLPRLVDLRRDGNEWAANCP